MANVVPNLVNPQSSGSFLMGQSGISAKPQPQIPSGPSPWSKLVGALNTPAASSNPITPSGGFTAPAVSSGALQGIANAQKNIANAPQTQVSQQSTQPVVQNKQAPTQQTQNFQGNTTQNQSANTYQGTTPIYGPNGATSFLSPGGTLAPGWSTVNPGGTQGIFPNTLASLTTTQPSQSVTSAQGSLMGQTKENPAQSNIQNLQNIAQNGSPAVQQATQNVKGLQQAQGEIANNPNLAAEVASGRGQALASQIQAAQTGLTNALAQQNQQITAGNEAGQLGLTGQDQQITAAQNAGSIGNTAQSNQITAQTAAANQAGPRQQGYVLLDPVTGQPLGGSGGATNAAFQGGQVGAAETAGSNTFTMNQANTAAKGIQGTIQNYLASNPDINPVGFTAGNRIAQWLQGKQLGDPKYQTLANYLNEYTNTLAPILGVGGDPTNLKTEIANSFINGQASGKSISQVLNDIGNLADQKLANLVSAGRGGGQVAGGFSNQGSSGSLYDF